MGLLQTVTLALAASSGLVAADGLNARAQKIGKVRIDIPVIGIVESREGC
jgi:hypothetical protein